MKNTDIHKTSDTHDNETANANAPDTKVEEVCIDGIDETEPQEPSVSDTPNTPPDAPLDTSENPSPDIKAGSGAGMSDAVMPSSIDAADSDAINNNLEALASGRIHLHVGA